MEIMLTTDQAARIWVLLHSIGLEIVLLMLKAFALILACHWCISQLQRSSAEIRHLSWFCFFLSLALLPLMGYFLPAIEFVLNGYHSHSISEQVRLLISLQDITNIQPAETSVGSGPSTTAEKKATTTVSDQHSFSFFSCIALIYISVVSVKLFRFYQALQQLHNLNRRAAFNFVLSASKKSQKNLPARNVNVYVSKEINSAITWGIFNPCILLPQQALQWNQATANSVLAHELAHIQRNDWLTLSLTKLISILFFPLPGLHNAFIQCSLEAESSADNQAIIQCSSTVDYAQALLALAKKTTPENSSDTQNVTANKKTVLRHPIETLTVDYAVGICGQSEFSTRIFRIIEPIAIREKACFRHKFASIIFTLCFVVPLATLHPIAKPSLESYTTLPAQFVDTVKSNRADPNSKALTVAGDTFTYVDTGTDTYTLAKKRATPTLRLKQQQDSDHLLHNPNKLLAAPTNTEATLIDKKSIINDALAQLDNQFKQVTKTLNYHFEKPNDHTNPESKPATTHNNIYPAAIVARNVIPKYPKRARQQNIEGEVRAIYTIDQHGKADNIEIISSKPNAVFDKAVIKAIKRSIFHSNKKHIQQTSKQPTDKKFEQTYLFRLTNNKTNAPQRYLAIQTLGFNTINSS